jgi:hypothetical protein
MPKIEKIFLAVMSFCAYIFMALSLFEVGKTIVAIVNNDAKAAIAETMLSFYFSLQGAALLFKTSNIRKQYKANRARKER